MDQTTEVLLMGSGQGKTTVLHLLPLLPTGEQIRLLIMYRDYVFIFLYHTTVPPDNNDSERAIRNGTSSFHAILLA